jgi:hypothetical protein
MPQHYDMRHDTAHTTNQTAALNSTNTACCLAQLLPLQLLQQMLYRPYMVSRTLK